jgi:hypothetical protein
MEATATFKTAPGGGFVLGWTSTFWLKSTATRSGSSVQDPKRRLVARKINTNGPLVKSEYLFMGTPRAGKRTQVVMEPAKIRAERVMRTIFDIFHTVAFNVNGQVITI